MLNFFFHLMPTTLFFSVYIFLVFQRKNLNIDPLFFDSACSLLSIFASVSAYFFIISFANFVDFYMFAQNSLESSSVTEILCGCDHLKDGENIKENGGRTVSEKINYPLAFFDVFYCRLLFI